MSEVQTQTFDAARHVRDGFDCGDAALNAYFAGKVESEVRKFLTTCIVAVEPASDPDRVVGFATVSAAGFDRSRLTSNLRRRFAYGQVPAARLGRLAVDVSRQGRGVGEQLLAAAAGRVVQSGLAAALMLVDAKDDRAADYYRRFGFRPTREDPLVLYATTVDLAESFAG